MGACCGLGPISYGAPIDLRSAGKLRSVSRDVFLLYASFLLVFMLAVGFCDCIRTNIFPADLAAAGFSISIGSDTY